MSSAITSLLQPGSTNARAGRPAPAGAPGDVFSIQAATPAAAPAAVPAAAATLSGVGAAAAPPANGTVRPRPTTPPQIVPGDAATGLVAKTPAAPAGPTPGLSPSPSDPASDPAQDLAQDPTQGPTPASTPVSVSGPISAPPSAPTAATPNDGSRPLSAAMVGRYGLLNDAVEPTAPRAGADRSVPGTNRPAQPIRAGTPAAGDAGTATTAGAGTETRSDDPAPVRARRADPAAGPHDAAASAAPDPSIAAAPIPVVPDANAAQIVAQNATPASAPVAADTVADTAPSPRDAIRAPASDRPSLARSTDRGASIAADVSARSAPGRAGIGQHATDAAPGARPDARAPQLDARFDAPADRTDATNTPAAKAVANTGAGTGAGTDAGAGAASALQALAAPAPVQATQAARETQAPAAAAPARPEEQLAVRIAGAVKDGHRSVSVDMRPEALGRVSVQLRFHEDKTVSVQVTAERHETYAMLSGNRTGLERQLQQAGIDLGAGGLDLRFGSSGSDRDPNRAPQPGAANRPADARIALDTPAEPAAPATRKAGGASLIDIDA